MVYSCIIFVFENSYKYIYNTVTEAIFEMADKKLIISPKKYSGETSVVSARLPNKMIQDLDKAAEKTGRNRNEIITMCLEFALENLETGNGGKEE